MTSIKELVIGAGLIVGACVAVTVVDRVVSAKLKKELDAALDETPIADKTDSKK